MIGEPLFLEENKGGSGSCSGTVSPSVTRDDLLRTIEFSVIAVRAVHSLTKAYMDGDGGGSRHLEVRIN